MNCRRYGQAVGGALVCALFAGCGSNRSATATPGTQYDRVFNCLVSHGYVGPNRNRRTWPRLLEMVNKNAVTKNEFIVFSGSVFKSQDAAQRDGAANARYIDRANTSSKKRGLSPTAVRAISRHWLSARYFPTAAARACVLKS